LDRGKPEGLSVANPCAAGAIIVFRKSPVFCWWYGEGLNSDQRLLLWSFLVGGPSPLSLFLHTRICSCCYRKVESGKWKKVRGEE
jgi:hypothetical protein